MLWTRGGGNIILSIGSGSADRGPTARVFMRIKETTGAGRRFHVPDLQEGPRVLSADQAHHAWRVLRLAAGDEVTVFDGLGRVAGGRIESAGRKGVTIAVGPVGPPASRPQPVVEVAFAVPKGKRVDWLIEKTTELGAASLRPILFERSVAGGDELSPATRRRWMGQCVAAARQCELNFLPELHSPQPLEAYLGRCEATWKVLGDVAADGPKVGSALDDWRAGQTVAVLIGPEGDLTDRERGAALEAGFRPARLGQTILRVETAAVALLAGVVAVCERSS